MPRSSDAHIGPSSALRASSSRICNDTRFVQRLDINYTILRAFIGAIRRLLTEVFQFTKDGSLLFKYHRIMRKDNLVDEYMESLRRQVSIIETVIYVSETVIAMVHNDSTRMEIALQCQQDVFSIILDAQASIAVLAGFLSQLEYHLSSGPRISYVV